MDMKSLKTIAQRVHRDQLKCFFIPWLFMQSNETCLYCLQKKPEYVLTCDYAVCETCIQIFGRVETVAEYIYRLNNCLLCHSGSIRVTLRPSTAGFRVLSIDEESVREMISLEFLSFLQEAVESTCKIQELFDLTFGISSGKTLLAWRKSRLIASRKSHSAWSISASLRRRSVQAKLWHFY